MFAKLNSNGAFGLFDCRVSVALACSVVRIMEQCVAVKML